MNLTLIFMILKFIILLLNSWSKQEAKGVWGVPYDQTLMP